MEIARDPLQALIDECMRLLGWTGNEDRRAEFEFPEHRTHGEVSTTFALKAAKQEKRPPRTIANELVATAQLSSDGLIADLQVAGPGYVNFFVNHSAFAGLVVNSVLALGSEYGAPEAPLGTRVLIEHTSVNPNKPWHVGHLRNAVLGDTLARILRKAGHTVEVQNYINDGGRQVAETIYALDYYGAPSEPQEKYDHFVAQYYVRFHEMTSRSQPLESREDIPSPDIGEIEAHVVEVLHELEEGRHRDLVRKVVEAQLQTAWSLGIFYDVLLWDSDIVGARIFEEAIGRLKGSPKVHSPTDGYYKGCLVIETETPEGRGDAVTPTDLQDQGSAVVLIRSNGVPTYVGKDIAYHLWKSGLLERDVTYSAFCEQPGGRLLLTSSPGGDKRTDPKPDQVINVIGDHQAHAQSVVYSALRLLGYDREFEASHHLSYGLVRLEEGAMSGRRGVGVAADRLVDMVYQEALDQLRARREDELDEGEMRRIAQSISVGAIRFEMCRYNPATLIVFRIRDVVDLDGYCAVYVLYAYVRCLAILAKANDEGLVVPDHVALAEPVREPEFELVYKVAAFPFTLKRAADLLEPSQLTTFAYELANLLHRFYLKCPVLSAEPDLRQTRLAIVKAVATVLESLLDLLGIPLVEQI